MATRTLFELDGKVYTWEELFEMFYDEFRDEFEEDLENHYSPGGILWSYAPDVYNSLLYNHVATISAGGRFTQITGAKRYYTPGVSKSTSAKKKGKAPAKKKASTKRR